MGGRPNPDTPYIGALIGVVSGKVNSASLYSSRMKCLEEKGFSRRKHQASLAENVPDAENVYVWSDPDIAFHVLSRSFRGQVTIVT